MTSVCIIPAERLTTYKETGRNRVSCVSLMKLINLHDKQTCSIFRRKLKR